MKSNPPSSALRQRVFLTVTPIGVFVLHAALFGRWIDDDAGISFAYARNLAAGHGLVSQPGTSPVEGYSNFLWVLLMAGIYRIGLFHVVWTPKIVACILTAGSFLTISNVLVRTSPMGLSVAAAALTLVGLQPAFVIWSISGLENPLYVFLLCALMAEALRLLTATSPRTAALSGFVAAGVMATRPDGVIYLPVVSSILLVRAFTARDHRKWFGAFTSHATVLTALVGGLVAFRWWYFGDIFPNTYYMKGGPTLATFDSTLWLSPETLLNVRALAEAIAGFRGAAWLLAIAFAGSVFLATTGHFHLVHAVFALFSVLSGLAYFLLPADWMGEYRFASPFFLFFYTYFVLLAWSICTVTIQAPKAKRRIAVALLGCVIAGSLVHVVRRSVAFAQHPAVPLQLVAETFGHRYNRVADALGLRSASLLLPDVGGTLLYTRLTIIDLGGLCDRTIARTLGKDQRAFYDYVFMRVRPTFIHVHDPWKTLANFDADERFRRDYVPIREGIIYDRSGAPVENGDFVRRDALRVPVEILATILAQ